MTSKNWAISPTVVKSLLIYWHFWPVVFIALLAYFGLATPNGEALKFFVELKQNEFKEMPVSIIIGFAIELSYFLCPVFAWKMLNGNKVSRAYLEVFAWIFLFSSLSDTAFPQIWYVELDTMPSYATDISFEELIVGIFFTGIDALVLLAMRSKQVKGYVNVF